MWRNEEATAATAKREREKIKKTFTEKKELKNHIFLIHIFCFPTLKKNFNFSSSTVVQPISWKSSLALSTYLRTSLISYYQLFVWITIQWKIQKIVKYFSSDKTGKKLFWKKPRAVSADYKKNLIQKKIFNFLYVR